MIGKLVFIGFCLLAYLFALVFYRELPSLIDLMPGAKAVVGDNIKVIEDKTHPSLLVVTVVVTAAFLTAVKSDFRGNILYRFRSLIYSMISVTSAFDRIRERLLNSRAG